MAGEKSEKATPKRRSDERKKGNVFKSQEVIMAGTLVIAFYGFKFFAPLTMGAIQKCLQDFIYMSADVGQLSTDAVGQIFATGCLFFGVAAMPILLLSSVSSILISGAQTRFNVAFDSLKFKGDRINPISGFKKMFSMRGLVELIKSLFKITLLGAIIWNQCQSSFPQIPHLMDVSVGQAMVFTGELILSIVQSVAIIFAFIALFDYGYQWWEYEKNLRMSKQEIKEEYKETEGDPQIKGKIKEKQQAMARNRMMQNVPSADVIIRNPTHYAIAIRYDPERNNAPMVIAKGADFLALKIIEIAELNGVFITENRPLARGLYDAVDLEQEIPEQFYQPVAEVLAFVYSLKKKELR